MENIGEHLTSILEVMCLVLLSFAYIKKTQKKYGEKLDSVQWTAKHIIARMKLDTMTVSVCSPAVEEVLFRAPLIIMFSSLSSNAWYGIILSSALFSLLHLPKLKIANIYTILAEWQKGNLESDSVKQESARLLSEQKVSTSKDKIIQLVVTFCLGVMFSYIGIVYQSLWLCVTVHAIWNLVGAEILAKITIAMKNQFTS